MLDEFRKDYLRDNLNIRDPSETDHQALVKSMSTDIGVAVTLASHARVLPSPMTCPISGWSSSTPSSL